MPMHLRPNSFALAVSLAGAFLYAQAPAPRFEVASVKPSLSPAELRAAGKAPPRPATDPGRYAVNTNLSVLLQTAYGVKAFQLTGPDWMAAQYVEIAAKLPEGANKEQVPEMLQALLAERFRAVVRRETKDENVYLLTVGKDGPKLKAGDPDAKWVPNTGGRATIARAGTATGWIAYSKLDGMILFDANNINLPDLASRIRQEVDLPVIDKTGLQGTYAVSMNVPGLSLTAAAPAGAAGSNQASDPSGVNIFKSVEKLGLKLEKGRAPIEHILVEHLEKAPTAN